MSEATMSLLSRTLLSVTDRSDMSRLVRVYCGDKDAKINWSKGTICTTSGTDWPHERVAKFLNWAIDRLDVQIRIPGPSVDENPNGSYTVHVDGDKVIVSSKVANVLRQHILSREHQDGKTTSQPVVDPAEWTLLNKWDSVRLFGHRSGKVVITNSDAASDECPAVSNVSFHVGLSTRPGDSIVYFADCDRWKIPDMRGSLSYVFITTSAALWYAGRFGLSLQSPGNVKFCCTRWNETVIP